MFHMKARERTHRWKALTLKRIEPGATNTREHTQKSSMKPKERMEHDRGTKSLIGKTCKGDKRNENAEKENKLHEMEYTRQNIMLMEQAQVMGT